MVINISGEYFLGIISFLIWFAWQGSSRFTRLETKVDVLITRIDRIEIELKELQKH